MTQKKNTSNELSFEKSLDNLEKIVSELESGELSLEKSLDHFEKGVSLYKECKKVLEKSEKKISRLTETMKVEQLGDKDF